MADSLTQFKSELESRARMAEGYARSVRDPKLVTLWADRYCEAMDKGDERGKDVYISALMLKSWDQLKKMYEKTKTAGMYSYEEYTSILCKCIMVACHYRAWQKPGSKTNAQACINQAIASRGVAEIMYDSNRDTKRANVNALSMDAPIDDSDGRTTFAETIVDEGSGIEQTKERLAIEGFVQHYIDDNKIIEAIIFDTIAFDDCFRDSKSVKTAETEEGETVKYVVRSSEFKKTECKRCLSSLPEDYDKYFFARYSVDKDALEASLKTLRASNDQKLSRFIVKTLADAKKNAKVTRELLAVD